MLQSIAENNNKKKVAPNKSVANFDKTTSGTTNKNQQPPNVSSTQHKKSNVPPFLLTFKIFNINVHNCMVDSQGFVKCDASVSLSENQC
jgi:hypothetical protein